jgi:putative addiction module component (TIGR02574 family)
MTEAVVQILEAVRKLSDAERADVADRIFEGLNRKVPSEISEAQVDEVRRRIVDVESGKVELIPGDVSMARIWKWLNERVSAS